MTNIRQTLKDLPKNQRRILAFLDSAIVDMTMTEVSKQLGLNYQNVQYATGCLRDLKLVSLRQAFGVKRSAKILFVNADTVERSDIEEMIHNV
jgi:DNA-binding transcriptional ArsR family regulator